MTPRRHVVMFNHLAEMGAEPVLATDQFVIAPAGCVGDAAHANASGDEETGNQAQAESLIDHARRARDAA